MEQADIEKTPLLKLLLEVEKQENEEEEEWNGFVLKERERNSGTPESFRFVVRGEREREGIEGSEEDRRTLNMLSGGFGSPESGGFPASLAKGRERERREVSVQALNR